MDKKPAPPKPRIETLLADALEAELGFRPLTEQRFHPTRRWRIDLLFPEQKLAIEVDGNRHLNYGQRTKDCDKRNALALAGYKLLTYPATSVLTKKRLPRIVQQISRAVCGVNAPELDEHVLIGD